MLLFIDNYDSFTYNLVHYIGEVIEAKRPGAARDEIRVERNDALTAEEAVALKPDAIVLSPGPCDPDRAGVCLDLVKAASADIPLLGVCLGHQSIGQAFGGDVTRTTPMHGKTSQVSHQNISLFRDLPQTLTATRYHSLIVARETLPDELEITAETADGTIMGFQHKSNPTHGVQFHPESVATEHGRAMLTNFLRIAEIV
ncbi:MAG: aminodeoxychorismate/anthranilate synthase component II [Neomegalonema sp.]|nr:aminodeoxychorismate/anthranilate synthase component II [Neomegalonema sp.]